MGKRDLIDLLSLSSWCLVIVVWLFLVVPWVCLQFVVVVFSDHNRLLILIYCFMCLPLFVGILCWSLFWYSLLCVLSSLAMLLSRKRELVAFLADMGRINR